MPTKQDSPEDIVDGLMARKAVGNVKRSLPSAQTTELAMRVVNLRRALDVANGCLRRHGQTLLVAADELDTPTFREGRKFWAEVRELTKETP